jgi:hypothetical protein
VEGPRLASLKVTSSTAGAVVPRFYRRLRIGGNIIWTTDLREVMKTEEDVGGKGGGGEFEATTYTYHASRAVGLWEGPIATSAGCGRTETSWT